MEKIVYLSGDHAGFDLKEKIKSYFEKNKIKFKDFGSFNYNKEDDYPDFVIPMAKAVSKNKNSLGISIAGSGVGECILANKVKGVRAVLYHGGDTKILKASKEHNNSNVLTFGSRFVSEKEAKKAISVWFKSTFTNETRHKRRLNKFKKVEKENLK